MDQSNGVVERDQVHYRRYGVAPTLSLGIDTPTRLTFSYFKEEENNLPDYGIPFIDGAPAHVERSNYYSLANYDRTRTNTNIGTIRFEHDFSDSLTVSDSLRYANYGFEYLVTGPFLGQRLRRAAAAGHAVCRYRYFPRPAEQRRYHQSLDQPHGCDREVRCGRIRQCAHGRRGVEQGAVQCEPFPKRTGRYSRDAAAQSGAVLCAAYAAHALFQSARAGAAM